MSTDFRSNVLRALLPLTAVPALLAVSSLLFSASVAQASGRVEDEISRTPVFFSTAGNCGSSYFCQKPLLTSAGGKSRTELSSITCIVGVSGTGTVSGVIVLDDANPANEIVYLPVQYNGIAGNKLYTATTTARFRLAKNTQYKVEATSSTTLAVLNCAATGEKIKYSN
jgi:hypothetical protein